MRNVNRRPVRSTAWAWYVASAALLAALLYAATHMTERPSVFDNLPRGETPQCIDEPIESTCEGV